MDFRAKKSYGQHFLHRQDIAKRIASSLLLHDAPDQVLEVGPGTGMLTQFLLERFPNLYAVEADQDMVAYQQAHFPQLGDRLLAQDFMKLDFKSVFGDQSFSIIGNFPYNISSQIIFRMLEHRPQVPELVGMFQREMALRVVAPPGNKEYGIISVLVQMFYKTEYLFSVDKSAFNPPPKVQSAVIRLTRHDKPVFDCDEKKLRLVVKTTFNNRRKMLRNTMKPLVADDTVLLDPFFTKRPEQLNLEEFARLSNMV